MDLRIFTEPQMGASYDDQLRVAQAAEAAGYDAFFRSDHFLVMGEASGEPGPTDSWVTLGALARETSRIRLGTLVTSATFRLPGPLAIAVAQVDAMSRGRVELGLGSGWFAAEHEAYGIPFPGLGERFDRLTEQLEIITGLWRTLPGERFSYTGAHYAIADSPALPKPVQQPHPPLWIGGESPAALRRAVALGDAWYPIGSNPQFPLDTLERYQKSIAALHAEAQRAGRDPATLELAYWANWYREGKTGTASDGQRQLFTGSDGDVAQDIEAFRKLGVRHLLFNFARDTLPESIAAIERFASKVLPLAGK